MVRNWALLPQELLELCSQHLCPKDLQAFRAVCRSWQSASHEVRSNAPWLMLADENDTSWREYFCLSCQRVHRVLMSEAKAKRCLSSQGWVLTLGTDWELYILKNPMSHHNYIIKLPNLSKFPGIEVLPLYDDFTAKFVLSASPATSLDYMVMVIYGKDGPLGLCKPGDKEWTAVSSPRYNIWDLIFYKGCFVALDCSGSILRCDVNGPTPFEAQVIFKMPPRLLAPEHPDLVQPTTGHPLLLSEAYLVQSTRGSLLLVSRWEEREPDRTFRFQVFEIDLNTQTCTEVKSLGDTSLFLGPNSSFSLEVDEKHHIKPNRIYFTDDYRAWSQLSEEGGGTDMGIYHIEDCTTKLYFMAVSYDHHYSPPLWIEPSF